MFLFFPLICYFLILPANCIAFSCKVKASKVRLALNTGLKGLLQSFLFNVMKNCVHLCNDQLLWQANPPEIPVNIVVFPTTESVKSRLEWSTVTKWIGDCHIPCFALILRFLQRQILCRIYNSPLDETLNTERKKI